MSVQLNVTLDTLTQQQRESVAGFILMYPGTLALPSAELAALSRDAEALDAAVAFTAPPAFVPLVPDSTAAIHAFGAGGPASPLPLGAMVAPSTAVAAPLLTVPVASPVTFAASVSAPPVAMPVSAGTIAAPPTVNPAPAVEVDANGLPWDARIHAESKNKVVDGTWRKKRQLDPVLLATVEAELKQLMSATRPHMALILPGVPVGSGGGGTLPVSSVSTMLATGATASGANADARQQFVGLIGRASAALQAGKVTQVEITECCAQVGVPALPLLANRLDLVSIVAAKIDVLIASRP